VTDIYSGFSGLLPVTCKLQTYNSVFKNMIRKNQTLDKNFSLFFHTQFSKMAVTQSLKGITIAFFSPNFPNFEIEIIYKKIVLLYKINSRVRNLST